MDYKEQASYLKRRSRRQFEDADENAMYQAAQSIMELLDRAEAAEARCKRLDEARERANEAAHQWEGRCKILETRLETAEKMVKEYQDVIVPGYRERAEKAESEKDGW